MEGSNSAYVPLARVRRICNHPITHVCSSPHLTMAFDEPDEVARVEGDR